MLPGRTEESNTNIFTQPKTIGKPPWKGCPWADNSIKIEKWREEQRAREQHEQRGTKQHRIHRESLPIPWVLPVDSGWTNQRVARMQGGSGPLRVRTLACKSGFQTLLTLVTISISEILEWSHKTNKQTNKQTNKKRVFELTKGKGPNIMETWRISGPYLPPSNPDFSLSPEGLLHRIH